MNIDFAKTTQPLAPQGVLYCATHNVAYLAQAFVAARSVKAYLPGIPIALFTDMTDHPLVRLGPFDEIFDIRIEHRFESSWATGKLPRISALTRSPYAKTLHLDCDTRITHASARQIFTLLNRHDIAMVECHHEESFSRLKSGLRMFNGGMMAFCKSVATDDLFERWHDLTLSHHQMGNMTPLPPPPPYLSHISNDTILRRLLKMDQISLAQYLSPDVNLLGLDIVALDDTWNARNPARLADTGQTIKINHAPKNRSQAWKNLAAEAAVIAQDGDNALAAFILDVMNGQEDTPIHRAKAS